MFYCGGKENLCDFSWFALFFKAMGTWYRLETA